MTIIIELAHEHYKGYKIINYSPQCYIVYGENANQAIWEDYSFEKCKKWIDKRPYLQEQLS